MIKESKNKCEENKEIIKIKNKWKFRNFINKNEQDLKNNSDKLKENVS